MLEALDVARGRAGTGSLVEHADAWAMGFGCGGLKEEWDGSVAWRLGPGILLMVMITIVTVTALTYTLLLTHELRCDLTSKFTRRPISCTVRNRQIYDEMYVKLSEH